MATGLPLVVVAALLMSMVTLDARAEGIGGRDDCPLPVPDKRDVSAVLYAQNYVWLRNVREIGPETRRPAALRNTECFVSDRFKFVFHHVLKNGGSNMMVRLKLAIGETIPGHRPGEAWPNDMHKRPFSSHDGTWLRKASCKRSVQLSDYLHFSFVRDPYSRLRSILAFAAHLRRADRAYSRPLPSLEELARSSNPESEFQGATSMSAAHGVSQHVLLMGSSGWTVDFIADLNIMAEAIQQHIVPVLKARLAGSGIDLTPLDTLSGYFDKGEKRTNAMTKKAVDPEQERRIRCLLYRSAWYGPDFSLFYATHEQKRQEQGLP